MRNRFDDQLELLNIGLIKMGALCEDAITLAGRMLGGELELKDEINRTEQEIDQKERDIESLCMRLLLQQQPVARDLRIVSSALKMISDMERIGDQAADIADIAEVVLGKKLESHTHLKEMAEATSQMVTISVDSFVKKDLEIAKKAMEMDDVIDKLFDKVKDEVIELIRENSKEGEGCIDVLMIAKYFERIGDHATNIAEWVEYSITGEHV